MNQITRNRCINALNIVIVVAAIWIAAALFLAQVKREEVRQANVVHETHIKTFWALLRSKGKITVANGKGWIGNEPLENHYELPDQIQSIFGGTATIFIGNVRVSTNVRHPDGTRAVGTRLEGAPYRAVFLEGRPYRGEAVILGVPYFAAYDPIKDARGHVVGAIYVGEKKSEYLSGYLKLKRHVVTIAALLSALFSLFIFATGRERRRSTRTLQEREQQRQAILNNIPDLAWLKDKDGRFIAVNDAFAKACGISPEEVVGKTDFDVWPKGLAATYQRDDHEVMETGAHKHSDEPLVYCDGRTVWTEAVRTPICDERGNLIGLTGIARDITDRRRMEKSLQDSEATLLQIFHNVNDGIILHDLDGTIISLNDRAVQMYALEGIDSSRISALSIAADLSSRENNVSLLRSWWDEVHTGRSRQFEWKARRPGDGSTFDVEVFLNGIRLTDRDLVLATITDISERKQNEAKIKHTLSILTATLESTGDGILVVDTEKNIMRYNRNYAEMMQIDVAPLVRQKAQLYLLEKVRDPEKLTQKLEAEEANPYLVTSTVLEFTDGRVIERVSHPQLVDRAIVGRVISYRDVTEQRRLENQLRHAQKMEAVGTLTGGIAHDFNNILTVIIGCGSVMQGMIEESGPLSYYLEQILTAAEKAAGLTRGLLTYSRRQTLEPRPVDLNSIVGAVHKLLSRLIGENIELETRLHPGPLSVMADGGQMEQVLMNLATNARDAVSGVGSITIETKMVTLEPGSRAVNAGFTKLNEFIERHGYGRQGAYALVSVTDTGKGMSADDLDRIFEPFYTTKGPGCGTGLGLSIVYGIVKQHNGYINVDSTPGQGTTFEIYLPITDPVEQSIDLSLPLPQRHGDETILFIEDNRDIRNLFKDLLTRSGYRVIEAGDGEQGVEQFRRHQDEIDLLLIDVIMPKKNGKETYDDICAMAGDVKAIFISGYTDDIINQKGILEDNLNFLSKPLAPEALLEKVRAVLDQEQ
ncbi:PAS domain S-box protein [Geomonas sp. RF6]|uniref:PAS domain S-box protein n=1 Tax=Geomonas sp. RF6 TaxID=2897342 RepID=UPI001E3ACCF8|nr:PAS domain S-box protein [Geomonas sp. RF6]UFS70982.1 PAS domain S-box protein [Geomonas sp. RF6]